jgi:hypothetical protein
VVTRVNLVTLQHWDAVLAFDCIRANMATIGIVPPSTAVVAVASTEKEDEVSAAEDEAAAPIMPTAGPAEVEPLSLPAEVDTPPTPMGTVLAGANPTPPASEFVGSALATRAPATSPSDATDTWAMITFQVGRACILRASCLHASCLHSSCAAEDEDAQRMRAILQILPAPQVTNLNAIYFFLANS